jgi:hypothetical protein
MNMADDNSFYPEKRMYQPGGHIDVSSSTAMPSGLLSMRPIIGKGVPTAAKHKVGNDRVNREMSAALRHQLAKMAPKTQRAVNGVALRKR